VVPVPVHCKLKLLRVGQTRRARTFAVEKYSSTENINCTCPTIPVPGTVRGTVRYRYIVCRLKQRSRGYTWCVTVGMYQLPTVTFTVIMNATSTYLHSMTYPLRYHTVRVQYSMDFSFYELSTHVDKVSTLIAWRELSLASAW
jgi:hypothetical protein